MMGGVDRFRLGLALAAAAVAALLVIPFAIVGHRRTSLRLDAELAAEADQLMAEALAASHGYADPPANAWQVNPTDRWANPLSEDSWASPPVFSLAEDALAWGTTASEYEFDGVWLAHARRHGDHNAMVVVVNADERDGAKSASARNWTLAVMVAIGLAAAAGEQLGRRLQAPVERAHLVNRDFIADAAHELRTPLSIIQASAGHALARERSPDDYRESLAEILVAAERAGDGVGELLEFARLEAGQASMRLAPLRVDLLVEEVAVSVRVDGTTVEVAPSEAVVAEADYNLIRQVVDNITRNAAARADKVTVSAGLDGAMARIDVTDNGPGFDPGMIDHVFERFRRGDRSGSAGLGMTIARTIVELHGGRCEARNLDEGGAMVSVFLPLSSTSGGGPGPG